MEEIKEQARKNAEEKWKEKLQKSFSSKIITYQNKAIDTLNEELNIFDNNIKKHIEDLGREFDITWSQKFEKEMNQYEQIINDINDQNNNKDNDLDDFCLFKDDDNIKNNNININNINNFEDEDLGKKPIDLNNIKKQPTVILKELDKTNSLINLILQCLSNINKFISYYLNPNEEEKILLKSKQDPQATYLGPSLLKLLNNLWKSSKNVYSPNEIHEVLKKLMKSSYNSSDPGYLISFILKQLNKELNIKEVVDEDEKPYDHYKKDEYLQKFMTIREKNSNVILNNFFSVLMLKKRCNKCVKYSYFFENNPVINIYLEVNGQFKLKENLKSLLIENKNKKFNDFCPFCRSSQENILNQDIYATYNIIIFNIKRKNNSNIPFLYPDKFDGRWVINYAYALPNYELIAIIKEIPDIKNKRNNYIAYIKSFIDNNWYAYTKEKIEIVKSLKEINNEYNASLLIYQEIKGNK